MRVYDQAPPTVAPHLGQPPAWLPAGVDLVVAIEKTAAEYPRWDDAVADWDGDEAGETWDATAGITSEYLDAVCDMQGLEFTTGAVNPEGTFDAGELALTLDNRSGRWSQYNAAGQLVDYLPGRGLKVWAVIDGEPWWLWSGVITAWREVAEAVVEVEAFDAFSVLQQQLGKWTPGTLGQGVAARLGSIVAFAGYTGPTSFTEGDVTLLTEEVDSTPLEEMQRTSVSDGGVLGVDADGVVFYWTRRWRAGRVDQVEVPLLTSNVCDAEGVAVVWDPVLTTDDEAMANLAVLANIEATPVVVQSTNTVSLALYGPLTLPEQRTEDLWQTAGQGQALADALVAFRGDAHLRVEEMSLHLHDPRHDYWQLGIDRRLGDVVEFLHDYPTAEPPPPEPDPLPLFTGGVETVVGGYRIHTFLTSGTLTMVHPGDVEYLVVAGGGGGAGANSGVRYGGAGGAGGLRTGLVTITTDQVITVGAGGAGRSGALTAFNGSPSSIGSLVSCSGGGGGGYGNTGGPGSAGGSGGGGGGAQPGGAGTPGEGNAGSAGTVASSSTQDGGGGGGAGAAATTYNNGTGGGNGGAGLVSSISGAAVTYAGGGGGASQGGAGDAGIGGGGAGAGASATSGTSGTPNTGGGGGGAGGLAGVGGNGGSGIVIVRYPTS